MKFIKIKGLRETRGSGFDQLENLPQGCGDITLERYGRSVLWLVY